jgi:ABC toxin-like protein/neuraminidase-like protein
LVGIFPEDLADLELGDNPTLLAPDIGENTANDPVIVAQGKTPSQKRLFFLQYFIPFLQDKLARVLIGNTITSATGFNDRMVAQTVLDSIALDKTKSTQTTMDFLLNSLKQPDTDPSGNWSGYLAPLTSDSYIFSVSQKLSPSPIVLNGAAIIFTLQQVDPQPLWSTTLNPVKLTSGTLYNLQLVGIQPTDLEWKATAGSRMPIPSSVFLPNRDHDQLKSIFMSLQKLAIAVNNFKLNSDEITYMDKNSKDFGSIDFMHLKVASWKRLRQYVKFRDSLPLKTDITLLQLFTWAVNNSNADRNTLGKQISAATTWSITQIGQILDHLLLGTLATGTAADFVNEQNLSKFTDLIVISSKLGVDIPRLFSWTYPLGTYYDDFFKHHDIAEDIQKVARSRYNLQTWPTAVKPVNDTLRSNQQKALIDYLLVQDEIISLNIRDADGLFEYFLIDTQMTPLVETSRIKQAIATVQVYVQRCLLGLEEPYGVPATVLDRGRWNWMQRETLWEANRKVFCYPENWIDPSLRDDKSDIFKELEAELLQKDLSPDVVSAALKNFLYSVSGVSNMAVVGLCVDYTDPSNTIHLFTQTRTAPYSYYYNTYATGRWTNWKKMGVEVPSYTVETSLTTNTSQSAGASGVYFAPIAFNKRVIVFIPQIMKKTVPPTLPADKSLQAIGGDANSTAGLQAQSAWEIKLSWTEYRNGAWTPRQLCPDGVIDLSSPLTPIDAYSIVPVEEVSTDTTVAVDESPSMIKVFVARDKDDNGTKFVLGEWHFQTGQLSFARNTSPPSLVGYKTAISFGYGTAGTNKNQIHSFQAFQKTNVSLPLIATVPYSTNADPTNSSWGSSITLVDTTPPTSQPIYHTRINEIMSASMSSDSVTKFDDTALFSYLGSLQSTDDAGNLFGGSQASDKSWTFDELSQPFSLYNWELGLHAPMSVIDRLHKAQQFDQALNIMHYIFNPTAKGIKTDMTRFWVFAPFKNIKSQTLKDLFMSFQPNVER